MSHNGDNAALAWAGCRKLLGDYPVVIDAQVAWGEMDAFAHVNNTVYFRYFESARIAYFQATGFLDITERTGVGPILAETSCRFRHPLRYPDYISIGARVVKIEDDRFEMNYAVANAAADRIAAEGTGLVVAFDYKAGIKAQLPGATVRAIQTLEAPYKR